MYGLNIDYSERKYCYAQKNLAFGGYTFNKCPSCGRQIAKELLKTQQDMFVIEGGKQYPDFLYYGGAGLYFLVSERVMAAFIEYGVTGYEEAVKVPVYRMKGDALTEQDVCYYLLNINGSIDFDLKAMSLKRKNQCSDCGQFDWNRQRLSFIKTVFDMDTWDKSDLCRIASFPGYVVCSEKLKNIIEKKGFNGVTFQAEDSIFRV